MSRVLTTNTTLEEAEHLAMPMVLNTDVPAASVELGVEQALAVSEMACFGACIWLTFNLQWWFNHQKSSQNDGLNIKMLLWSLKRVKHRYFANTKDNRRK